MRKRLILNFILLFIFTFGASQAITYLIAPLVPPIDVVVSPPAGWKSSDWPFLKDQFPAGLAFDCLLSECSGELRVTVRTKIGFCNCVTGVSDDDELERVSDLDLLSMRSIPFGEGREISIRGLKGRIRLYSSQDEVRFLTSIAYNNQCDVVVVTGIGTIDHLEEKVKSIISSNQVYNWVSKRLRL